MTTAVRARKRAVGMLGALAAVLLLAGVLPWATGADTVIRVLAVGLLLAGLMVLGALLRVSTAPARSAPPVERGCDGCACGISGGCAVPERTSTA